MESLPRGVEDAIRAPRALNLKRDIPIQWHILEHRHTGLYQSTKVDVSIGTSNLEDFGLHLKCNLINLNLTINRFTNPDSYVNGKPFIRRLLTIIKGVCCVSTMWASSGFSVRWPVLLISRDRNKMGCWWNDCL